MLSRAFVLDVRSKTLIAMAVTAFVSITNVSHAGGAHGPNSCIATGEPCSLGIDPDIYQMPLTGELIQSGNEFICATTRWSTVPPEAFDLDFMRNFYLSALTPEQQAGAEAAAFFFLTTHWGPPASAPADLTEVVTPSGFPGEVFENLELQTTRVEFEVPKTDFEKLGWEPQYLPVSVPPDPDPDTPHKLRGWYIQSDESCIHGFAAGSNWTSPSAVRHGPCQGVSPLIVISTGFPYSIAFDQLVGGIDVGRQFRKAITYFVSEGFDVFVFDKRGHGYSEGLVEGMGEDIFRALDQLEHGTILEEGVSLSLTLITPDGRKVTGAEAAAVDLLGRRYSARTKPIVLRGFSYGSSQLQKAMAMNYTDLPVEYRFERDALGNIVVDPTRTPPGNRGYNFRGIIAISGFQGSLAFETVPYFLTLDALAANFGHNGAVLKSSVYESMRQWPAFLGLYATNDFETADGAIDAYNERLRGFKELKLVTGYHFGLVSEEVDTFFAYESARFAKKIISGNGPTDNLHRTTYAKEVCDSERVVMDPATQTIVAVQSRAIEMANTHVNRVLARWVGRE